MVKGRKADIEDLQVYLSDFYELVQGIADRGQIEDTDDPDFNVNLVDYFLSIVEPLEMRTKMQEFKETTFAAAITRFQSYLLPDTISLVKNIRDRNFLDRHYDPFVPKVDTPRKASIAHDVGAAIIDKEKPSGRQRLYSCDNCTRPDGSPGMHMSKNCPTSPCKACLALDGPSAHPPKLCFRDRPSAGQEGYNDHTQREKCETLLWCPPQTTHYDYHRYADEYWGCLVEDAIPYVESDDDDC